MSVVDVWLVPVVSGSARDPGVTAILDAHDRLAIESLGFAADRDRAATARAAARRILGDSLGVHPRLVPLVTRGRPVVDGAEIGVSWSHSGGWVALAIAPDRPVGVDIERRRRPQLRALLQIGVGSLEEFVAREAVGKATGRGLTGSASGDLSVRRLPAPHGYVAAVAAPGDDWATKLHLGVAVECG